GLRPCLLDIGTRDRGTGRGERQRGRAPDPVRRADDHRDLSLERERRIDHGLTSPAPWFPALGGGGGAAVPVSWPNPPWLPAIMSGRSGQLKGHDLERRLHGD